MKKFRNLLIVLLLSVWVVAATAVSAANDYWTASYWNNKDLEGDPVIIRSESELDHDWGEDAPVTGIDSDNFSARWTRHIEFDAGTYRFAATTDDGMRVYVDDELIIDAWYDSQSHTVAADIYLGAGEHRVKVEYYEAGGGAVARLSWGRTTEISPAPLTQPELPPAAPGTWQADFYNNVDLLGEPVWTRTDDTLDFIWGSSSPVPNVVNADGFSVRWTGALDLGAGQYYFTAVVDGGVRVWVDGELIIDRWDFNWEVKNYTGVVDLAGGSVPVIVEYFEDVGLAEVRLTWSRVGEAAAAPSTTSPTTTNLPALPEGSPAATLTGARALNVRSGPGLENESIGFLTEGQTVMLTGYRDYGGYWIEIVLPDGGTGWVSASYMSGNVNFMDLAVKGI